MVDHQSEYPVEYELCFGKRPLEELYDVRSDPDQVSNLAGDARFSEIKSRMWQQLQSHLKFRNAPRMDGHDPWQSYIYRQTNGFQRQPE